MYAVLIWSDRPRKGGRKDPKRSNRCRDDKLTSFSLDVPLAAFALSTFPPKKLRISAAGIVGEF